MELNLRQGTVFSYVMDKYDGDDEKPHQDGVFTFHYAISTKPQFEAATLAKFWPRAGKSIENSPFLTDAGHFII
jgi:hypothetical protein